MYQWPWVAEFGSEIKRSIRLDHNLFPCYLRSWPAQALPVYFSKSLIKFMAISDADSFLHLNNLFLPLLLENRITLFCELSNNNFKNFFLMTPLLFSLTPPMMKLKDFKRPLTLSGMGLIYVENLELLEGNWFIVFIIVFSWRKARFQIYVLIFAFYLSFLVCHCVLFMSGFMVCSVKCSITNTLVYTLG